jgi:hypothetical protein
MLVRPLQEPALPAQLDAVVDFVADEPVFVGLVVALLLFVFFMYLFLRRTILGMREGYDDAYRGK